MEILVHDIADLPCVAKKIIDFASNEKIWVFEGEMGAGKTTLIKAVAQVLGVGQQVSSPSFAIVNVYESPITIYHFDFYRLNDYREALAIGIEEYLDSGNFCWIEWAGKVAPILPPHYLLIHIEVISSTRKIKLSLL